MTLPLSRASLWCFVALPALLPACATVEPKPFEDFRVATVQFQSGADDALAQVVEVAEVGFASPSTLDAPIAFSDLLLVWEEEGDVTQPQQDKDPLHVQIRKMRRGTYSLNAGIVDYATALDTLAGGGEADAQAIDELAASANTNLRAARDATGLEATNDQIAILATVGAAALRQKIENDRCQFLQETMSVAQGPIDRFAEHMTTTIDLAAGDVKNVYLGWADTRGAQYTKAKGDAQAQRRILIELQARNDKTTALLDTLRALRSGYEQLPQAHRDLHARVCEGQPFVASVRRLYEEGKRLQKLQKELAAAESE